MQSTYNEKNFLCKELIMKCLFFFNSFELKNAKDNFRTKAYHSNLNDL